MVKHGVEAEELQAYLDGELIPARRVEIEGHLRTCRECPALIEDLKRVSATLQQWEVDGAPASLRPPAVETEKRRRWFWQHPELIYAGATAMVVVVGLLSFSVYQRWQVEPLPEKQDTVYYYEQAPAPRAAESEGVTGPLPARSGEINQEPLADERQTAPQKGRLAYKTPEGKLVYGPAEPVPQFAVAPEEARGQAEPSTTAEKNTHYYRRADVPAAAPPVVSERSLQEEDAQLESYALGQFEAKDEIARGVAGEVAGSEGGGRLERRAREAAVATDAAAPLANRVAAKRKAALRMVAYHVNLTLEVKEFETAKERVYQAVEQAGGYIAQASTAETPNQPQRADLVLRVPVEQLSAVLDELRALGRVTQEQISTEEVTEQVVDLEARLRNARATEERLIAVLNERTGKVGDILEVEREIARTREELERMEARRQNLMRRVEMATLQVALLEEFQARLEPAPVGTGTHLRNAFVEGYQSFAGTLLSFVFFFARNGLNLIFWGGLLWLTWRVVKRTLLRRLWPTVGFSPGK